MVGAPILPVFFTDNTASTGTSPEITEMEAALLSLINSAQSTIDLAIYDFNRDSIRDALIAAHNRGVQVRVVTDDEAREHIASYIPYYAALESAGIAIVDDDRANDIMHNKAFVIDELVVWTGSTNQTDNGYTKNHNNSIVITDTAIAELYTTEFNQMFEDGKFSVKKDQLITTTFDYNGVDLDIHFSPEGNVMDAIIAEVDAAQEEIAFAIFFFTSDPLRDALINAKNRGVRVRGVWDNLGASNAYSDDEALCEANIPIKIENYKGKMHNKTMIIDPNTSKGVVVTGSVNWTNAGFFENDENTIIIHDSTVATLYKEDFDMLYDTLPAELACVEEEIVVTPSNPTVYLPMVINPADPNAEPTPTAIPTVAPTATPTPTQTPTPAPAAKIELLRIVYNPDGDDVENELVEITNSGDLAADMMGYVLQDETGNTYTFPTFTLEPASTVTVWVKVGTDNMTNLFWGRGGSVWNNSGDTAFILDEVDGNIIDSCSYLGGEVEASCQ
ncbi:MAG: phospholipase D-like domain-containing protein [Chloroflexota bacterium]